MYVPSQKTPTTPCQVDAAARGLEARRERGTDEWRRREDGGDCRHRAGHAEEELEDAEVSREREFHKLQVNHVDTRRKNERMSCR